MAYKKVGFDCGYAVKADFFIVMIMLELVCGIERLSVH